LLSINIHYGNYFLKYSISLRFTNKHKKMLKGKVILITGGGSGIGEALAINLSKDNKIIICGRDENKLQNVATANTNVSYYVANVSIPNEIDDLFKKI